jgi:hypothetical protein
MADIDAFTTYVQGKISDIQSAASAAADDLKATAQGYISHFYFSAIPAFAEGDALVHFTPANITMDTVAPYDAPDTPVLSETIPIIASPDPIDMTAANAALAGFDPASYDPSAISGEIIDLADTIMGLIDSGGPGISNDVQAALWAQNRARRLQSLDDVLLRVRNENAMSGWPVATSIHDAAEAEHRKKYQDDGDTLNNKITEILADKAHQMTVAALNQGVSLTQIKSNLQATVWQLYYSMQKLILDEVNTLVDKEVKRLQADIQKILADYEAYKTRVLVEKEVKLDVFKALASGEEIRVRSETTLAEAEAGISIRSNELLLSAAEREALAQIEIWKTNVNTLTERGKADIQELVMNNGNRVDAAKTQADYYKNLVLGLTQMVSTLQISKQ